MKKVYTAPQILFESFTMSTNIAAGCESIVGNPTQGTCAVLGSGGVAIFNGTIGTCDFTPGEIFGANADNTDEMMNGLCYHVPTEELNLFNS